MHYARTSASRRWEVFQREYDVGLDMKKESCFCQVGKQERKEKSTELFRAKVQACVSLEFTKQFWKRELRFKTCLYLSSTCEFRIQPESLKSWLMGMPAPRHHPDGCGSVLSPGETHTSLSVLTNHCTGTASHKDKAWFSPKTNTK